MKTDPKCAICDRPKSWHAPKPLSIFHDWHRFQGKKA